MLVEPPLSTTQMRATFPACGSTMSSFISTRPVTSRVQRFLLWKDVVANLYELCNESSLSSKQEHSEGCGRICVVYAVRFVTCETVVTGTRVCVRTVPYAD
jgi:hypothetical protein